MSIIQHYVRIHSVYRYAEKFKSVANIQEALALVMCNNIKAEIIGQWLYCFTNALIGCQLEAAGFWFSFKHRAFIYSGRPKDFPAFDESLDEIRARLGSEQVKRGNYGKNN